ncbi:uncharacterized protein [Dendrobates tinctorius]|uniref:uncharacterized protein n=1 Tax=Dendrobates tinctorius TaxID=92724 RepID=UPI003CC935D3
MALHIRGKDNVKADFLSRKALKQGEWALNRDIYHQTVHRWGQPEVDLFATRENRKEKSFCSLNPRENPLAVDALLIRWNFSLAYAFPPLNLLPLVVRKIREDRARVILIAPFLVQEDMVRMVEDHVGRRSLGTAQPSGSPLPGASQPPTSSVTPFDGVVFERTLLKDRGFSKNLIDTLLKSRKLTTTNIYARTWKRFPSTFQFDVRDGIPTKHILEFLQKGLELGLSTSTLKVQVSALGALFACDIANNYWAARFIKAAARSRPIHKDRCVPWDLNLVLTAMTESPFEPLDSASLKIISLKAAFLVAITSARRVSDIQALSRLPPLHRVLTG